MDPEYTYSARLSVLRALTRKFANEANSSAIITQIEHHIQECSGDDDDNIINYGSEIAAWKAEKENGMSLEYMLYLESALPAQTENTIANLVCSSERYNRVILIFKKGDLLIRLSDIRLFCFHLLSTTLTILAG